MKPWLMHRRECGGTLHLNSELLFRKYGLECVRGQARILEIGPDAFPSTYQAMVGDSSSEWHTLDLYESGRLTYRGLSEYSFPIPDDRYDIVLSGQVVEHVRKPWLWMKELARVCRVGGKVITINPVSWPYHEAPIDCWRAYPEGMKAVYDDAGLKVLLSIAESIEPCHFKRYIPGRSQTELRPGLRAAYAVLGVFEFPVERAVDTITIGEKV
jgi:SAM-dependent methyltransferase